jgi:nucleoid-associated protein YgaU
MFNDKVKSKDVASSSLIAGGFAADSASAKGVYKIQCHDKDGNLKWEDEAPNLVVNEGLQDMNAKYFTGTTYTAAWYLGVYGSGATNSPAAGDTMASHAGWTEVTAYSQATRPACTFGTPTTANPSVATNSASPATFSINGTTTIGGAFVTSNNTKSGTTGTLYSAADFSAPGDRSVVSGDTLSVTYTLSLAG